MLLTHDPAAYVERDDWLHEFGGVRLIQTKIWGPITERRFLRASGLQVELGVGKPAWATTTPIDEGTRRVVLDGMRCIYDPGALLQRLRDVCSPSGSAR